MTSDPKRYYATLGVDPRSSEDTIRTAYRRRAKELHPDSERGDTEAFIRLKRAYDVLADPAMRAHYDRSRVVFDPVPPPPVIRPRPPRARRFVRYAAAFVLMAAVSLGGVEWMINAEEDAAPMPRVTQVQTLLSPEPEHRVKSAPALWQAHDPAPITPLSEPAER